MSERVKLIQRFFLPFHGPCNLLKKTPMRSLKHLVTLANELMELQIGLINLNDLIDTTTPQGRLVFNIFASLAELERDLIRERTQVGLKAARPRGRPRGLSEPAEATAMAAETLYREGRLSVRAICDQLGISKPTFCAYLKHRGVRTGSRRNSASGN